MATISDTGGGKRGLNPEVNLVPFIDLLSVCICFLLISAVWLNVGSLQVKQALGTAAEEPPADLLDIEVSFIGQYSVIYAVKHKNQTALSLELKSDSRRRNRRHNRSILTTQYRLSHRLAFDYYRTPL